VEDDGHLADEGQIVEVAEVGVHARYYSFVMKGQSLLEVLNYAKKNSCGNNNAALRTRIRIRICIEVRDKFVP
jgi:hypothetical protein